MNDQVMKLEQAEISATFLGSAQHDTRVFDKFVNGNYFIVYVTPEKLQGIIPQLIKLHKEHGIQLFGNEILIVHIKWTLNILIIYPQKKLIAA